jgi:plasmid replication initiation protein
MLVNSPKAAVEFCQAWDDASPARAARMRAQLARDLRSNETSCLLANRAIEAATWAATAHVLETWEGRQP